MLVRIFRDNYLNQLIENEFNGTVKIITGIRRCGKSYLLFEHIKYRDPSVLYEYINSRIDSKNNYYILIDKIQHVPNFYEIVNSFTKKLI